TEHQEGFVYPPGTLNSTQLQDIGLIYIFDTKTQRTAGILRGHRGTVASLAFAPAQRGKPLFLASAGRDWDRNNKQWKASVRLWDVHRLSQVSQTQFDLPPKRLKIPPGLAIWHTGTGPRDARIAIAWEDGVLRIWNASRSDQLWQERANNGSNNNNSVAHIAKTGLLLTGRFFNRDGRLEAWDISGQVPQIRASN